jgi:single-stranded DNA-binding protein
MFNQCFISGRVFSEPELDWFQSGTACCTFRLAFQAKRSSGGKIDVTCLEDVALFAGRYLHRGDRVALAGTLYVSEFRGNDQETWEKADILATALELVKDDDNIQVGGLPKRRQ